MFCKVPLTTFPLSLTTVHIHFHQFTDQNHALQEVGCDEVVGSPWQRDACGVCKGDNSSCRAISGIFTSLDLSRGLNEIVRIPAGSTHINVTGLRYSINWLGQYIHVL